MSLPSREARSAPKWIALLTVTVGAYEDVALFGLSTLQIPPDDTEPVAEIQIGREVTFS
jgi:hypothetical protein